MATRHPGHGDRGEVRRLDHQLGGRRVDLGGEPAHGPGQAHRPGVVGDDDVAGVEGPRDVVQRLEHLARLGPAYGHGALQAGAVEGVQRLTQLEHHVVGDVDGQRHRPHAAEDQPAGHPERGGGRRVEAGDRAEHQPVGGGRVDDDAGVPAAVDGERLEQRRVVERDVVRGRGLAGEAAHGQRVRPVGGDRDVEHLVAQVEQVDRVGAELGVAHQVGRQHQDAVVVVTGAELAGRADHAVAEVSVGLAGGDREAARQGGAGQRDHHVVADGEVEGTADDAPRLGLADVHRAPPHGLAVGRGLVLERQHPAQHDRSVDVVAGPVDGLHLEAGRDQPGRQVAPGDVGRQVGVLPQPGQRRPHQSSVPNGRAKRTSPSTMSRMSSAPCRDIRVRSIPMPNAKPV